MKTRLIFSLMANVLAVLLLAGTATLTIAGTGTKIRLKLTRDYTTETLDADVKIPELMLKCIRTLA